MLFILLDNALNMTGDWMNKVDSVLSAASKVPERLPMSLDNLAYVVYSSGTTGKPKGIKYVTRYILFANYASTMQASISLTTDF